MINVRPEYKTPEVVTYRDSEILKQMGPLKGGSGDPAVVGGAPMNPFGYDSTSDGSGKRAIRDRSLFERDE